MNNKQDAHEDEKDRMIDDALNEFKKNIKSSSDQKKTNDDWDISFLDQVKDFLLIYDDQNFPEKALKELMKRSGAKKGLLRLSRNRTYGRAAEIILSTGGLSRKKYDLERYRRLIKKLEFVKSDKDGVIPSERLKEIKAVFPESAAVYFRSFEFSVSLPEDEEVRGFYGWFCLEIAGEGKGDREVRVRALEMWVNAMVPLIEKYSARKREEERLSETRVRLDRYRRLNEIAKALASVVELDELLELIMEHVMRVTKGERGFLMLIDRFGELQIKTAQNIRCDAIESEPFRFSRTAAESVAESGTPLCVVDAQRDERFTGKTSVMDLDLRTVMCVPLKIKQEILGVIYVDSRDITKPFSQDDLEFFQSLAGQASVALENARLTQEKIESERLSAIGKMAGTIIHDLKSPLNTIRGYGQVLKNKSREETIRQSANFIIDQADRMNGMIAEVLEFTRGSSDLKIKTTNLAEFFKMLMNILKNRSDVQDKQMKIECSLAVNESFFVNMDAQKMVRVFENLTSNSTDAVAQENGKFVIKAQKSGNFIEITAQDNGTGIPEKYRKIIFEPFVSFEKKGGTGLGLATAKRIVEAHGGALFLKDSGKKGTCFLIRLPFFDKK